MTTGIKCNGLRILATINKDRSITEKHKHGRRPLPMRSPELGGFKLNAELFSTPASCTLSVASEPVGNHIRP